MSQEQQSASPPRALIEVEHVTLRRADHHPAVLQDVSFCLMPGENVALLGANGSGKTTLVHLLNGTLVPDQGRVRVRGLDTTEAEALVAVRRTVGLLFQDPDNQFVTTTVEREIAFGLENLQVASSELRRQVEEALEAFDLQRYRHAPPHEMSGGEKARLALACVWVMGAQVLVLDETESLLDRRASERLSVQLMALPSETSVVRVTTDAERASQADRVLVLHEGRLIADGPPDSVWPRLEAAVLERIGVPLAWSLSRQLRLAGCAATPTGSWETLLAQVRRSDPSSSEGCP